MIADSWTSLEIAKLAVGVASPLMLLIVGVYINRSVNNRLHTAQKLVEKRIEVFDAIGPDYNLIYTFLRFIGPFKENSPADVIAAKRRLDQKCFVYAWIFEGDVATKHQAFMEQCFSTYRGPGLEAGIRNLAGRYEQEHPDWQRSWDDSFDERNLSERHLDDVERRYCEVMNALTQEFNTGTDSRPFVSGEVRRLRR